MRWARFLARNGITALHFDYRGVGESTGDFSKMSFRTWQEDVEACASWLGKQMPELPMALCGLGLGGLLVSESFKRSLGDALLLWSPPPDANAALKEVLIRRVSFDYARSHHQNARTFADYVKLLEANGSVSVEGYPLTGTMWRESFGLRLDHANCANADHDRVRVVKLTPSEIPLISGIGIWRALNPRLRITHFPLNPNLDIFFGENVKWLRAALKTCKTIDEKVPAV